MGVVETTTWTCDRCGRTEEQQDKRNWQPDDWALLQEIVPPLADPDEGELVGYICRPCRSDLREWLVTPP